MPSASPAEQAFQLHLRRAVAHLGQRGFGVGDDVLVVFSLAHRDKFDAVVEFLGDCPDVAHGLVQAGALAHQGLGVGRIVPEIGVFAKGVQFVEAA